MLMTCPDSSDRVPFRVRPFPCIVHDNLSGIIDFEHSHARVVRKLLSSGLPACWYAGIGKALRNACPHAIFLAHAKFAT